MPSIFPVLLPSQASSGGPRGRLALSACARTGEGGRLVASERVQLLPAGEFRSLDGRPEEVAAWYLDGAIAATLIAEAAARETPYVVDYHHQSLVAADKGIKAPAAGWFSMLEWTEGVGLFAIDVRWTDAARAAIESDEFRYLSPVFAWERATGKVTHLINAALTNTPGLDGMAAVADRITARLALQFNSPEPAMDDLLERVRYFLNLPITVTAEEAAADLQKLIDQLRTLGPDGETAASESPGQRLMAALAQRPDPAQSVPLAVHAALQSEIGRLHEAIAQRDRADLLEAALADGRILPATEAYWREAPVEALRKYLAVAKPVAVLSGMQSASREPEGAGLARDAMSLARAAQAFQDAETAAGRPISIAQAVAHCSQRAGGAA